MKIAIIAYNHPESSLPLAKYLSDQGNQVDYYYITSIRASSTSAFDFSRAGKKYGITELNRDDIPDLYGLWPDNKVKIHLIRIYFLPFRFFPSVNRFFQKPMLTDTINELNNKGYDIINLIGQNPLLMYFHKNLTNQTKIHSLHEVAPHYAKQKLSVRFIQYLIDNNIPIIVHSQASYISILNYVPTEKAKNIFNVPFGLFKTYLSIKSSESINITNYLLFYGMIRPYKGLDILLKAIDKLKTRLPDLKIIIAGGGKDSSLSEFKMNPNCTVINRHLSNEELVELNIKAKAIVCPYKSGSQSGIVTTSFLYGKPIIATNVGGFSEIIKNNENGILVQENSVEELADAIYKIFTDQRLYNSLKESVNEFEVNNPEYCWEAISKKTEAIYKSILFNKPDNPTN